MVHKKSKLLSLWTCWRKNNKQTIKKNIHLYIYTICIMKLFVKVSICWLMTIQLKGRKWNSHLLLCLVVTLIIIGKQDVVGSMIEIEKEKHICGELPWESNKHEIEKFSHILIHLALFLVSYNWIKIRWLKWPTKF